MRGRKRQWKKKIRRILREADFVDRLVQVALERMAEEELVRSGNFKLQDHVVE